jgi:hypothetical protein
MAAAAHGQDVGASTRRQVVSTAMENMTAARAIESCRLAITDEITAAAIPSWRQARRPATRADRPSPKPLTRWARSVIAISRSSASATGQPRSIVTGATVVRRG